MKPIYFALLTGLTFMCTPPEDTPPTPTIETDLSTVCRSFKTPRVWSFCITKTKGGDPGHLVYYFHGFGGDQHTWVKSNLGIRQHWRKKGIKAPTVVSITYGIKWLLAPQNKNKDSGLLEHFWEIAVPAIEAEVTAPIQKRSVMGVSMGGYSVAQLLFRKPNVFYKGVLSQAAITPISPYSSEKEIQTYTEKTQPFSEKMKYSLKSLFSGKGERIVSPTRRRIDVIFKTSKEHFPDNTTWTEASPLLLVQKLGPKSPSLYISCGKTDEYGLFHGSLKLADIAKAKGINVTWRPLEGGHRVINFQEVAEFLGE